MQAPSSRGGQAHPVRAVHTLGSLSADQGGPSRSVSLLCTALARHGTDVEIITSRLQPGEAPAVLPPADLVPVQFVERPSTADAFLKTPVLSRTLHALLETGPAVLHDHGIWLPTNHSVAVVARRMGAPRVVSIRGMLTSWALDQKRWKKKAAWTLYQRRDLQSAQVLHATAQEEVEDVRRLGLRQPIALIPNGVDVPAERGRPRTNRPEGAKRRLLFLSRIHPKKGLLNLVAAWAAVRPKGWECVLVGPDTDGHGKDVLQAAREQGVASDFQLVGAADDEEKWDLYRSSDLFVLPTFSENFGIVIAEALATGVPVITTTGAPWQELQVHDCGWWIEIGVEPLAQALREAVGLSDAQRAAMGQRGRALAERAYSWTHIAEDMAAVYAWLLGQGSPPACVQTA